MEWSQTKVGIVSITFIGYPYTAWQWNWPKTDESRDGFLQFAPTVYFDTIVKGAILNT